MGGFDPFKAGWVVKLVAKSGLSKEASHLDDPSCGSSVEAPPPPTPGGSPRAMGTLIQQCVKYGLECGRFEALVVLTPAAFVATHQAAGPVASVAPYSFSVRRHFCRLRTLFAIGIWPFWRPPSPRSTPFSSPDAAAATLVIALDALSLSRLIIETV